MAEPIIALATFTGKHTRNKFLFNKQYTVLIRSIGLFNQVIKVEHSSDSSFIPCLYGNVSEFLSEWNNIENLNGTYEVHTEINNR